MNGEFFSRLDGTDNRPLRKHKLRGRSQPGPVDLSRRVHRLGNKGGGAAVIELALRPVTLFLSLKPSLRERVWAKRPPPALEQLDHHEGVFALSALDAQPRSNARQEGSGRQTGRTSPGPARTGLAFTRRHGDYPAAPDLLEPIQRSAIAVGDHDLHSILVSTASGFEGTRDRDAAFSVNEARRVRPVGGFRLSQGKTPVLGGAL